jgi:hypothetical protein
MSLWAMQVFEKDGEYLMIYSAISTAGNGSLRHPTQQFGMARSKDLRHWEAFDSNPVLKNTETGKYYYPKAFHRFCWRDANLFKVSDSYYCILAARDVDTPREISGCTALLKTDDFTRWEALPPLFSPGKYNEVETPHIQEIGGKWVLIFGENAHSMSMRFALSDSMLEGNAEPMLNVFTPAHCYAGMMIQRDGAWYFYHWMMDSVKGTKKRYRYMTPPKLVELKQDFVFLRKHPGLDDFFSEISGDDVLAGVAGASENRAVVRKKVEGDEVHIRIRSANERYSRNVFFTKTKHGLSVRDLTLNDRFNESRTIPLQLNGVLLEVFFEDVFMEVYADGYLVYSIVLEDKFSGLESVDIN